MQQGVVIWADPTYWKNKPWEGVDAVRFDWNQGRFYVDRETFLRSRSLLILKNSSKMWKSHCGHHFLALRRRHHRSERAAVPSFACCVRYGPKSLNTAVIVFWSSSLIFGSLGFFSEKSCKVTLPHSGRMASNG